MATESRAEEIRLTIETALVDAFQVDRISAERFSTGITRELMRRFGGDRLYVPKVDYASRNEQVRAAFSGNNHEAICRKFDISRSTLYRIIRRTT